MPTRSNEQVLADALLASLPPVGTSIAYADWHAQVKASDTPEALNLYRDLKHRGLIKATLVANEDGTISHMVERVNNA